MPVESWPQRQQRLLCRRPKPPPWKRLFVSVLGEAEWRGVGVMAGKGEKEGAAWPNEVLSAHRNHWCLQGAQQGPG